MLVKVLNRLGLYTSKQYDELLDLHLGLTVDYVFLEVKHRRLIKALKASEEVKSEAIREKEEIRREFEKLRKKYIRRVKGKRI